MLRGHARIALFRLLLPSRLSKVKDTTIPTHHPLPNHFPTQYCQSLNTLFPPSSLINTLAASSCPAVLYDVLMICCSIQPRWVWSATDPEPLAASGAEEAEVSKVCCSRNKVHKVASHLAAKPRHVQSALRQHS